MANQDFHSKSKTFPSAGCFTTAAITIMIALLLGMLALAWIYRLAFNTPEPREWKICVDHALQIGAALDRYARRNDEYPEKLQYLSPDFLTDRATLHCPADPRPEDAVSYEYDRPKPDDPDSKIVLRCRRHYLFKGKPPVIIEIRKDGSLVEHSP